MKTLHHNNELDIDMELELELKKESPNSDLIIFLLEQVKEPDEKYDLLNYVYNYGSVDILKFLDDKYDKPEILGDENGTPLLVAVRNSDVDKAKYLIERGNSVDDGGINGDTPLLEATKHRNIKMIKFLLANKADINITDTISISPLHYAAENNYTDIVKLILENDGNANVNITDGDGMTPLHYAVKEPNNRDMVAFLIENGAECRQSKNKSTPLIHASSRGYYKIVELLVEHCDINHQDQKGKTALMNACHKKHFDIAKLLLEKDADKDIKDMDGYSIVDSQDEEIKHFFRHLKKHNPENLVKILNLFTKDNPIKYTTHSFEWSKYGSYQHFLDEVKKEFTSISDDLKFLSENLHSKISNFLFEDKTWGKYKINFGWSSLKLKEWCEEEEKKQNPKKAIYFPLPKVYQYEIDEKTLTTFNDICTVFKDEIEIRDDDKLKNIFIKIKKRILKFDFNVKYINLENITFYTDVEYFENAVTKIFEQFKERAEHDSIVIEADNQESYVDIIIEQRGSTVNKNSEEMKKEIDNGDFEDIKKYLFSLCDWSIESKFLDGNFRVEYLSENQAVKVVELKEKPQGFRHILRFYK